MQAGWSSEAAVLRCRSIVMLESNAGYLQLHELLQAAGSREKVRQLMEPRYSCILPSNVQKY